jgi:hypothetical protein
VNAVAGRRAVIAVELHSAPAVGSALAGAASSSPSSLSRSLSELVTWDWHGAAIALEHCDCKLLSADGTTFVAPAAKGFLPFDDELAVVAAIARCAYRLCTMRCADLMAVPPFMSHVPWLMLILMRR